MSNEELALKIQAGETELTSSLWDNVVALVRSFAHRFYTHSEGRGGVEVDDLIQIGYFAMLHAVRRYDPAQSAFSTFLTLYLRNYFQAATGRRYTTKNGRVKPKDALNASSSLNITVDDDEETELIELISDPSISWDGVDDRICNEQLREALETELDLIPPQYSEVIRKRFFDCKNLEEIAKENGVTGSRIGMIVNKGIRLLRKPEHLDKLKGFYDYDFYRGTGLQSFKSRGMSAQEWYVIRKENAAYCYKGLATRACERL